MNEIKLKDGTIIKNKENSYTSLMFDLSELEKLNDIENEKYFGNFKNIEVKIMEYRTNIKDTYLDYGQLSYFFILYVLLLKNKEDSKDFENFKNGNGIDKVLKVINNERIKNIYLMYYQEEIIYNNKYKNAYKSIVEGYKSEKIIKNNLDILVDTFWNIIEF